LVPTPSKQLATSIKTFFFYHHLSKHTKKQTNIHKQEHPQQFIQVDHFFNLGSNPNQLSITQLITVIQINLSFISLKILTTLTVRNLKESKLKTLL
jgi:hypothetical protein